MTIRWTQEQLEAYEAGQRARSAETVIAAPKPKRDRPEERLQLSVAQILDYSLMPPWRWFHVPNERMERAAVGKLSAMGAKPGAADVQLLGPPGPGTNGFGWVWMELKSASGFLSKDQREWRDWCLEIGAPWFLCRDLDAVITALNHCQIPLKGRLI